MDTPIERGGDQVSWKCGYDLCWEPRKAVWDSLARLGSPEILERHLEKRSKEHGTPASELRERAEHASLCLRQARHYFNAAASVPMAVRPELLYYSAYSLAFALIVCLSHDSPNIPLARTKVKKNHGLRLSQLADPCLDLPDTCAGASTVLCSFACRPLQHGTLREVCEVASTDFLTASIPQHSHQSRVGFMTRKIVFEYDRLPSRGEWHKHMQQGWTLGKLVSWVPGVHDVLRESGLTPLAAPGGRHDFTSHGPGLMLICDLLSQSDADAFEQKCRSLGWQTTRDGNAVLGEWSRHPASSPPPFPPAVEDQHGTAWYFLDDGPDLAEFPTLLSALFVLGMLVRYFPDFWTKLIIQWPDLLRVFEEFCDVASHRLPNLALNHMLGRLIFFTTSVPPLAR